ncbi:glycosyl hydrolase family 28-related protein [Methylobacterium radiotolerans]
MFRRLTGAVLAALLSTHAFAFDPGSTPRYPSPDMYRPNVDGIIARGKSSTGEIPAMGLTLPGTSGTFRSFLARAMETINVLDYGARCDGSMDDAAAINRAIAAAPGKHRTRVYIPGTCAIGSTINLGNGTTTAISTINGITLEGDAPPYIRLGLPNSLGLIGSQLKWIGPNGGTMIRLNGPTNGNGLRDVALDANHAAATCLQFVSASRGKFPGVTCSNHILTAVDFTVRAVSQDLINSDVGSLGNEGNHFDGLRIATGATGTIAISLDGVPSLGLDSTRNTFSDTYLSVPGVGSKGIRIAFADQNNFNNIVMTGNGTQDGTSCAIEYVSTPTLGGTFPQNNTVTGYADTGQTLKVCGDGRAGPGNSIDNLTTLDQQKLLRDPVSRNVTFESIETGVWPIGGYRTRGGQNVINRAWRNGLLNSTFELASRGTSFASPASGRSTLDGWYLQFDGAVAAQTLSRVSPSAAALATLPTATKFALRVPVGNQTSGNIYELCQRIPDVTRFSGRAVTLSAYMIGNGATPTISATVRQRFDSNRSTDGEYRPYDPSPAVAVGSTNWNRYYFNLFLPASYSNTVGPNNATEVCFEVQKNYGTAGSIDIAVPQFELGQADTAYEQRPISVDRQLMSTRLQVLGKGLMGFWFDTAGSAAFGLKFSPPLACASPTLSVAPGTTTVQMVTPGDNAWTATAGSTLGGLSAPDLTGSGGYMTVGGFSPATTQFRSFISNTDFILASCDP